MRAGDLDTAGRRDTAIAVERTEPGILLANTLRIFRRGQCSVVKHSDLSNEKHIVIR